MADSIINTEIRLKDYMSSEMKKVSGTVKSELAKIRGEQGKTRKSAMSLKQGYGKLKAVMAAWVGSAVLKGIINIGSEMESLTTQFIPLLGNAEKAKDRMKELSDFAARTPFQLSGVAKASKILEALTGGALSSGEGLRLVGDAASVSGEDFANLAVHVGRAFSSLKANRPAGEALMRLSELGLVTGETRTQVEDLQKAARGKEAWNVLEKALKKNQGGMDLLSQTSEGLTSTIKDQLQAAVRDMLSSGIWDAFRGVLLKTTNFLTKLLNDGTFIKLGEHLKGLIKPIQFLVASLRVAWNVFQSIGEILGTYVGSQIENAITLFSGLGSVLKAFISGDFKSIPGIISDTFKQMTNVMKVVFDESILDLKQNMTDMGDAWEGFKSDVTEGVKPVGDGFNAVKEKVLETTQAVNGLSEAYKESMNQALENGRIAQKNADIESEKKDSDKLKKMEAEAERLKRLQRGIMQFSRVFESSFMKIDEGAEKVFKSIADGFKAMLAQMAARAASFAFLNLLTGGAAGGATSVSAGFKALPGLLGFAGGGRPPIGKASIVGERGPELFVPDRAGTVVNNNQSRQVVNNISFSPTNNISPSDQSDFIMRDKQAFADTIRQLSLEGYI